MNNINHPEHYNKHPSGVECIDIVEHFNFNLGNAIKYMWRAGLKTENRMEDLEKAKWYILREIEREQKLEEKNWQEKNEVLFNTNTKFYENLKKL